MDEASQLRLKNSAILCIILGSLRLLSFMLPPVQPPTGLESFRFYFASLIIAASWQLYVGILGLVYWEDLKNTSITPYIARATATAVIFDGIFLVFGFISLLNFILIFQWPYPILLMLLGFPVAIVYSVTANSINKAVIHNKETCKLSNINIESKPINLLKMIVNSATVFLAGIVLTLFVIVIVWFINIMRPNIPLEEAIPWGIWESENPPIVLYINPDYRLTERGYFTYPALYKATDGDIRIFVNFGTQPGMIGRYRPHLMNIFSRNNREPSWRSLGDGFEVIDGTLHVTTNTQDLIFRPAETYLPIDISEWR